METVQGNAVVVGFDDGTHIEFPTIDQILTRLTQNKHRRRWWCYNIRFDTDTFLKQLPYENISELMNNKETLYKNWTLMILGNSNVVVKDLDRDATATVWDLTQFFKYLKLSVAAERYLPESERKMDSKVIDTFVDSRHGSNTIKYYNEHHNEINNYCMQDAKVTALLAEYFSGVCAKEGYNFRKPYSIGNMALKYFKPWLSVPDNPKYRIPRIHPTHYKQENPRLRKIENTFGLLARGGYNDCFQRGRFENAFDYDIISAYPSIMRDIPYWDGEWEYIINEDQIGDEAEYGYVLVEMSNLKEAILPQVYYYLDESFYKKATLNWINNLVIHCTVDDKKIITTLTLDQYRYLRERSEIEVLEGMVLRPKFDYFPLREPINILMERKRKAKRDKGRESPEYWLSKTMMNSTSGKFIQKFHTNKTYFYWPHVYGKITWKTKEIMVDLIKKNNAWDKIISVSTDGATFTEKLHNVNLSGKLGSFEELEYSEFVQIGNGIYYGTDVNGKIKQKLRGFHIKQKNPKAIRKEETLKWLIEKHRKTDRFEFPTYRPLHLRECYVHNKTLKIEDTNKFKKIRRRLDINREVKRIWPTKFENIEDMLSGRIIKSKPREIKDASKKAKEALRSMMKEQKEREKDLNK